MVNVNDYKKLGRVADGRIRKNWPTAPPFGPLKTRHSRSKGFENLLEQNLDPETEFPDELVQVSCYQNAVLQCLMHVPEFYHYLSRKERCGNERCYRNPIDEKHLYRCVYCALRDLAQHYWTSMDAKFKQNKLRAVRSAFRLHAERNPLDPNNGTYAFLGPGVQHDAHEYFNAVVNMLRAINDHQIDKVVGIGAVQNIAVDRLFEVKLKRHWICVDCGEVHRSRDATTGLQVPMPRIPNQRDRNLDRYITESFAPEEMTIKCYSAVCGGRNKERVRETWISRGPEILVIQMGRFRMNNYGHTAKMSDHMDYNELLDLSPYTALVHGTDENMALKYQLHGIVSHRGATLKGGHYVATVRCRNGVDFACVNDTLVDDLAAEKEIILAEAETRRSQSYILVYQKVGGKMSNCI